jgi:uncharacterized membrane protein
LFADPLITSPVPLLAVLLSVLAILFSLNRHPVYGKIFKYVPLIVFCYFVPTALSNLGLIPLEAPLYVFIKKWLLPSSLVLLVLSADIPGIFRLGKYAVTLFLTATAGIVIGGPLAYVLLGWMAPEAMGDQAWKGMAAIAGSWIGGGANFVAIGESVGANANTMSMMVVVDVAVANIWMAILLFFSGREKAMDEKLGADRSRIDEVRKKVEAFQAKVARPTSLTDLLVICAIALGSTAVATYLAGFLPDIGNIIKHFTWIVIIVTTIGMTLSFTRVRNYEGAGASAVGSVFLYLLITTIGASAEFAKVLDAPALVAVGAVWMLFHAVTIMIMRWWLKAPIFFAAVGSQANVGGAASAPVVASAFHPALAPVGVLLAVGGYILGTYAGLLCAFLLEQAHNFVN